MYSVQKWSYYVKRLQNSKFKRNRRVVKRLKTWVLNKLELRVYMYKIYRKLVSTHRKLRMLKGIKSRIFSTPMSIISTIEWFYTFRF